MSAIPSNLARVPNALASQIFLGTLNRTNSRVLQTQIQLSTGRLINRPSDDPAGSSLVTVLQDVIERREQRMRNLDHGQSLIDTADSALAEVTEITLEAKGIASSMIGPTVDPETRRNQAIVLDTMIDQIVAMGNRELNGVHLFGGERTGAQPFEQLNGGYRYAGGRDGMRLDLGSLRHLEVTLGGEAAFGALSTRVEGDRDLDPVITGDERLDSLYGARGLGVTPGLIELTVAGVGSFTVDLSDADNVQDVIDILDDEIAQFETNNSVTVLDAGRVSINSGQNGIAFDVAAGVSLTVSDIDGGVTAADLGLTTGVFDDSNGDADDLDPRLTMQTNLTDMSGLSAISDFVIQNGEQIRVIEASTATTLSELADLISQADIGARLEIDDDGRRINIVNELSGADMSIYETSGGTTADDFGIRTFTGSTRLSDFNFGRGVTILSGNVDPQTGLPDPALDVDFRVTLSDGTQFDVDLAGAETVADVVSIVQAAAPPTFSITIGDTGEGFVLTDSSGGSGDFSIEARNSSFAASHLGLAVEAQGATITGEDRSKVRVEGLLTHLISLRDALEGNDERGITFAGEKIEADLDRLAQARAILGQRANRISSAIRREEDAQVLDMSLQSQTRDLDFAEASVRFSNLQTQLQAAMLVGSQSNRLSLINFLR
ncbi:MAG: flagellin [Phycisphaerales bacterium]